MSLDGLIMYLSGFVIIAGIYGLLTIALNIQWGLTGLFNLGTAGFFAIGAYTAAILTTRSPDPALFEDFIFGGSLPTLLGPFNLGIDLWFLLAILAAGFVCAVIAFPVASITLRLRDDYLAITTLGTAETVRMVFLNEKWLANGSRGLYRIPKFLGDWVAPQYYDVLYAIVTLITLIGIFFLLQRLVRSPWGRVLRSIREDEVVTEAVGKNVFRFKVQAFVLGSLLIGIAGALFAHGIRFLDPFTFDPLLWTFMVVAMVIVGGSGSNKGAMIGAGVVWAFWSGTQFLPGFLNDPDVRHFFIGALIVVMLLIRPEGIAGETRAIYDSRTEN